MKYWPGVPTFAPSGLLTHICQVPKMQAKKKAPKATQRWARQSLSTLRTGHLPVAVGFEFVRRQDLHGRKHFTVTEAAILMTRHQEIATPSELGMHLRDESRHDHRIDIGAGDQDSMNDIGGGKSQRHPLALRHG